MVVIDAKGKKEGDILKEVAENVRTILWYLLVTYLPKIDRRNDGRPRIQRGEQAKDGCDIHVYNIQWQRRIQ